MRKSRRIRDQCFKMYFDNQTAEPFRAYLKMHNISARAFIEEFIVDLVNGKPETLMVANNIVKNFNVKKIENRINVNLPIKEFTVAELKRPLDEGDHEALYDLINRE